MRSSLPFLFLFVTGALPGDVGDVAREIELRYNSLAGLRVDFEHALQFGGRTQRLERGALTLLRPMRMRWEYDKPRGKLLVSDGERIRTYSPYTNQVSTVRITDSADFRAPLSFLLGRLNFSRQFDNLQLETIEGAPALTGDGRSGKEAYTRVEFFYDPEDFRLKRIRAYARDGSITEFRFSNEIRNPPAEPELFVFQVPSGAEVLPETTLDEQ